METVGIYTIYAIRVYMYLYIYMYICISTKLIRMHILSRTLNPSTHRP